MDEPTASPEPLNVTMLSWEFPPRIVGGIAPHVHDLSRELSRRGMSVDVITCDFPGTAEEEEIDGVRVHRVDSYKFPTTDFASWAFMMNANLKRRAFEILRPKRGLAQIIHAHDWLAAVAAIGLKHVLRTPLVATIHSTEQGRRGGIHTDYQRMIHQTESWLTHEAWRVICCSGYMASEVSSAFGLPRENIQVIPNGVDPTNFARPFSKDDLRRRYADPTEKLVLYVGRLVYEKGVGVLISAVPRVLSKVNAKFVIVGDGYMRDDLSREARRVGVADKVFFTGFLDDDTAKALYRCADVCVVPSLYEPFGIVALEAMASGTPVVATNVGGLGEIVDHGRTGVHVFPNDPDSLAWGILRVLTAEELSKALAPNAYEKALRVYSWKRIAEMTERVYRQVLAEYSAGFWKPT